MIQATAHYPMYTIGDLRKKVLKWNPANRVLPKVQLPLARSISSIGMITDILIGSDGLVGDGHRRIDATFTTLFNHYMLVANRDDKLVTLKDKHHWATEKALNEVVTVKQFTSLTAVEIYKECNASKLTKTHRTRDKLESFINSGYDWNVIDLVTQRTFARCALRFVAKPSKVNKEIEVGELRDFDMDKPFTKAMIEGFETLLDLKLGSQYVTEVYGFMRNITPTRPGSIAAGMSLSNLIRIVYKTGFLEKLRVKRRELKISGSGGKVFRHDPEWDRTIEEMLDVYKCKF